jgi:hypothetical protein
VKLRAAPGRLERTYHDLFEARFVIMNLSSGAHYPFSLAYGRSGALRGVPVQIGYQPNWWFKLVLSLKSTKPLNLGPSAGH